MNVRKIEVVNGSCQTIASNKSFPFNFGRTARVVDVTDACEEGSVASGAGVESLLDGAVDGTEDGALYINLSLLDDLCGTGASRVGVFGRADSEDRERLRIGLLKVALLVMYEDESVAMGVNEPILFGSSLGD